MVYVVELFEKMPLQVDSGKTQKISTLKAFTLEKKQINRDHNLINITITIFTQNILRP